MTLYSINPTVSKRALSIITGLLFSCLTFSVSPFTLGQEGTVREVIEAEQANEIVVAQAKANPNTNTPGRSPLATMLALREAVDQSDYTRASKFLDMRYLPQEMAEYSEEELLMALSRAWRRQVIIDLSSLSDDPAGNLEDGLPTYRDQVGALKLSTGHIPVYLQRVPDGKGGRIWKVSSATVAEIPRIWEELGYSPVAEYLAVALPTFSFLGMDNWQVVASILILIIAWLAAAFTCSISMRIALSIRNEFPLGIQHFFKGPMRLFLFIMIAGILIDQLDLSLAAQLILKSSGLGYLAITALLLGTMSLLRDFQIRKMQRAGNAPYVAILKPMTIIAKTITITVVALFWAKSAGYNISTIIAGLGVGSLAIALAAQKTLENVIGAFMLYAAKPINPGDFCRFGTSVGTVEAIGLRSTILRTLDRTQVVIPNSVFSSGEVENYSVRDRIRYFRYIRLQLSNATQLRSILAEFRTMISAHEKIQSDTVSVRLEKIEDATVLLRLDAGVTTVDYQQFLSVAEDINLSLIEIVHTVGAVFSGPEQTLRLQEAGPVRAPGETEIGYTDFSH
jgi:MscS family membrane protein